MTIKPTQTLIPSGNELPDDETNTFQTFRLLLSSKFNISVQTLATAVEQFGVYSWDRFGRFRHFGAETDIGEKGLSLLASICEFEKNYGGSEDDHNHPLNSLDQWNDPYWAYGWAQAVTPDFCEIELGNTLVSVPNKGKGPASRREDTKLLVIAALCEKLGIRIGERGAAKKIVQAVELLGPTISEETVKGLLDSIPSVVEKRSR